MTYTDRDLIELACRAPAVPEWFNPDMGDKEFPEITPELWCRVATFEATPEEIKTYRAQERAQVEYNAELSRLRLTQWPKAYARMVLEAKG